MLYFHLIDARRHHHHSYWTHIPIFWLSLALPLYLYAAITRRPALKWVCLIVLCNLLLHCGLDSFVSGIKWLYPLSDEYLALFPVRSRYDWWALNFVFNTTFLFELVIVY